MSIRIVLTKELPCERLAELYQSVGWLSSSAEKEYIQRMLRGSFEVAAAMDGDVLCGMVRALSDGVSDAYLLDLVVAEEYRHRGIGKRIVEMLADSLRKRGIDWIVGIGAQGTDEFYSRVSVTKMDGHTPYRFLAAGK